MKMIKSHNADIPAVGLGTWELRGVNCAGIVEHALRIGYRHVDTAEFYENEEEVGEGIRNSGIKRESIFVTTKVWGANSAAAAVERAAKQSLFRLRLDEVDLLLLHWADPLVPLEETMGALSKMKKIGLTQHVGVSNFTAAMLTKAVELSEEPIVTNQIEYHPFLDQSRVIGAGVSQGVATTAFCPIARGKVSDSDIIRRIAKQHAKSPAQVCLRWLLQQNVISLPRTSKVERLSENISIFDFELSQGEMSEIGGLAQPDGRLVDFSWAPKWD
jgi:2,5-diketo-D-gluconate reductase B